ncbi:lysine N(6)-hydroxylase/L-ornithine N(5)-oxygenase family protein [Stappia indica]|nr:lysine N(6)-hydroxylase/L-ornithine N(5)-oxygenase family protein [Stappia indica]
MEILRGQPVHDLVGIGFGPSNLAIAVAAREMNSGEGYEKSEPFFLEKREEVVWHPEMLLPDSKLQVNFLKDLALMRNPQSKYTFLNYLYCQNRLHEFINLRTFFPSRQEYSDYYLWVAKFFEDRVAYRSEVTSILPVESEDGTVRCLRIDGVDRGAGRPFVHYARNLSLAVGGQPKFPANVRASTGGHICHSNDTRKTVERICADPLGRHDILIIGAGQTAGDVFQYAINGFPNANITVLHRGFAFKPQDDTHFVNEIFFPEAVEMFYQAPEEMRRELLARHGDVTHSAVDFDLLPVLYDALYQDRATGRNRLKIRRFSEVTEAREVGGRAEVRVRDLMSGEADCLSADVAIFATGYEYPMPEPLLRNLEAYLVKDEAGRYVFERAYHIRRAENFAPKIYAQGYCEHTHGLSEILLSLMPIRAEEILKDIGPRQGNGRAEPVLPGEAAGAETARIQSVS